jgi:hypothetical protein
VAADQQAKLDPVDFLPSPYGYDNGGTSSHHYFPDVHGSLEEPSPFQRAGEPFLSVNRWHR